MNPQKENIIVGQSEYLGPPEPMGINVAIGKI